MLRIPWRKVIVIGSTFILGVCAGISILMAADPDFRTTFANNNTILTGFNKDAADTAPDNSVQAAEQSGEDAAAEQNRITSDYKTSLALLFEAWRSPDMEAFERKILNGYTGDIMNRHLDRAQGYIAGGKGISIEDLAFTSIEVESADAAEATVKASYTYKARDYDTVRGQAYGEKVDHEVHVRVTLTKVGERWLISGETAV